PKGADAAQWFRSEGERLYQDGQPAQPAAALSAYLCLVAIDKKDAVAFLVLSDLYQRAGDLRAADDAAKRALALAGDHRTIVRAMALNDLGGDADARGDGARSEKLMAEAIDIAREAGKPEQLARMLAADGTMAMGRGHVTLAKSRF